MLNYCTVASKDLSGSADRLLLRKIQKGFPMTVPTLLIVSFLL